MKLNSSEKQILELISFGQGISRKRIAELLNMTQGSITNMTKLLLEHHFIVEGERIGSGMGRKEVLLYANPRKFTYLGVDIGGHAVRFALSDNCLDLLHEDECLMKDLLPQENRAEALLRKLDEFLAKCGADAASLDAIGIGITGIVDAGGQIVLNMPNAPYWDDINLVSLVHKHFGCPVFLDEGGRTMAIAEQMTGKASDIADFIVVQVGYGIAAGIMINGQLLRGVNNTAGLLGHITADPHGSRCTCGNYGCLENIITFPMLEKDFKERGGSGLLIEAYRQNDKIALDVCIDAGQALGIALSNVVNLFNPDTIFIGGPMFTEMPLMLDETKRTITLRANRFSTLSLKLENTSFGGRQGIVGTLALAKSRLIRELSDYTP
ncbi:ROK family protein [Paenibacillus sp. GCM10027626]|uniref:ROK family transcriptional regulator n=1 Tax=Paenibacillus sp. GCM10027626 TaxID=3273411 RepID=UPI0036358A34